MNVLRFGNSGKELATKISNEVPRHVQLSVLFDTFPEGVRKGREFFLGSLKGEKGSSLRINIDTSSPWFLQGKDFESGDGVGGICKILKEGRGMSPRECFEYFKEYM